MPFFSGKCLSTAKLVGKTALITGCNTGIGKETVLDFYKRGAKVIMACRNLEKAEEAKNDIEKICKDFPDTGNIVLAKCDLTSLKSVRDFAQNILDTEPQINILVNNAGVMWCPKSETEDGFETQIGTNHLAHFLLTLLLLPRIRSSTPARIVNVSSRAHVGGKNINFDDINFKKRPYSPSNAYAQSKLANILFSRELAKKLKEYNIEGVNTYSLHPGVVKTELGRHFSETMFKGARSILGFVLSPIMKTPEMGAQTTIYCAIDEKCANETGLYYSDCAVVNPSSEAMNDESAKKLWDLSAELVKLGDFNPFTAPDPGEYNIEGVNTYSLHPGVVKTELGRHFSETMFKGARSILGFVLSPIMKTPEMGAQTTIYCAIDEKCANETGLYYSDCAVVNPSSEAMNDESAKKLWDLSAELVKLGDFNPFTAPDPGVKTV